MQQPKLIFRVGQILALGAIILIGLSVFQSFDSGKKENQTQDIQFIEVEKVAENFGLQNIQNPPMPNQPEFCNENLDLNEPDVLERFERELIVNTYMHGSTLMILKKANRYFPVIEKILAEQNVPDDLKYLCVAESGLAPVVSPAGARGFWQFMDYAGKEYGLYIDDDLDERYDIEKSTVAATKFLKESKKKFGSWTMAAAAYNAGNNGIKRQVEKQGVSSYYDLHLNPETSKYVFRIAALKYIMKNPAQYGFKLKPEDLYLPFKYKKVEVFESNVDWVNFAQSQGITYKTLLFHNPKIRNSVWKNRNGHRTEILIPEN